MEKKHFLNKLMLAILIIWQFQNITAQWDKPRDYIEAKKILVERCINCYDDLPDVDTNLLRLTIEMYKKKEKYFYEAIRKLEKPFPKYDKVELKEDMTKKERKEYSKTLRRNSDKEVDYWGGRSDAVYAILRECEHLKWPEKHTKLMIKEIKHDLFETKLMSDRKFYLLAMLNIPENLKDSILAHPKVPVKAKARLGDSIAMQQVIADFVKVLCDSTDLIELRYVSYNLFYTDTEAAWDVFFKALASKDCMYEWGPDINGTIYAQIWRLPWLLLRYYNQYFWGDIEYFYRNSYHGGEPRDLYSPVATYLSKKYKRQVKITVSERMLPYYPNSIYIDEAPEEIRKKYPWPWPARYDNTFNCNEYK